MKAFNRKIAVSFITLIIGVFSYQAFNCFSYKYEESLPKISDLKYETVSTLDLYHNPKLYHQKKIQIETYIYICDHSYFENPRICIGNSNKNMGKKNYPIGFIKLDNLNKLPNWLKEDLEYSVKVSDSEIPEKRFNKFGKRVKVLINGVSIDYCKLNQCCIGRLIFVKAQEVKQLEPFEKFDFWR